MDYSRNVKRFREGLVCNAHRLVYHTTLGGRVIEKKKQGHSSHCFEVGYWAGQALRWGVRHSQDKRAHTSPGTQLCPLNSRLENDKEEEEEGLLKNWV